MSEIKVEQVRDYSTAIAYANKQEIVYYETFGSYQGEWLLMTKDEKNYYIYKDSYGSCSGCDAYENDSPSGDKAVREFAKNYIPFAIVPWGTMKNLVIEGTLEKIFPKNIRDHGFGGVTVERAVVDISTQVKIDSALPIKADDVLKTRNQETKQRALRAMGYEEFVAEAKPTKLDEDGENSLLKIDDIVFVYVKDSSTPRRYLLRVPPQMKTVKEAVAWTFDRNAKEYNPIIET